MACPRGVALRGRIDLGALRGNAMGGCVATARRLKPPVLIIYPDGTELIEFA